MFGKKNDQNSKEVMSTRSSSADEGHNIVIKSTLIEGKVMSEGDFRIDGTFKGTLHCKAKVIIGSNGVFEGDIFCENAVIEGQFEGDLKVNEVLYVRETANIKGDVVTGKLVVQSGSIFEVNCKMADTINIPTSPNKVKTAESTLEKSSKAN
ncbi:bactofilin family protein [Membranihabitans marinus]|uniref:bactofilin family protein n=1 Tax=Membranihabitans marinus TaxID=1227546 RepID=UPI001F23CA7A|nr:polymer-forming cytoskeletal protein [Membranihabitans marinus]